MSSRPAVVWPSWLTAAVRLAWLTAVLAACTARADPLEPVR